MSADLATMAITAMTTSIASGAGSAVVDEVRQLVRSRLGRSEDGRGALERFEAEPGADEAANAVRDRLALALEADPEFAGRLWAALLPSAPPAQAPHAVSQAIHIGGDAHRSTIVIGPVQLPRTKGVMVALVAGVVVLAVLLVIGFRTVLHSVTDDDGAGGGSGDARRVTALKDSATAEAVLPDSGSLPAGWEVTEAAKVTEGVPDDCSTACEGAAFTATVRYEKERPLAGAFFYVQAYDTAAHAERRFEDYRSTIDPSVYSSMSLPSLGDESAAYRKGIVNGEHAEAGVLVGTVVTWVTYRTDSGELGPSALESLARMLSDRAQQAQNGTAPSARAEF
ncbi:hypothetical protein [Streptomyces sp. enrichment culture]|uniref:hypothetical protein n=1 Tax=Streptomyces sp. enrichment culture TaxID=1795815 RepID=UPI003F54B999